MLPATHHINHPHGECLYCTSIEAQEQADSQVPAPPPPPNRSLHSLEPEPEVFHLELDDEDSKTMQIKVRTLTGKEIELNIEPDYPVMRIKELVEEKEGIPPPQQRLIYGGKQMADDKTAKDYGLEGGATLHLVLALRGGL